MFKTLVAITASFICLAGFQMPAKASTLWQPCAFRALIENETTFVNCRVTNLRHDVFRLDWADGKSDIFVEMNNGTIQDSRGGLWITDLHSKSTGFYRSARNVNSGMTIVWRPS